MMRPTDRAQLRDNLTRTLSGTTGSLPGAYVKQVANAFKVSERTVHREIADIRARLTLHRTLGDAMRHPADPADPGDPGNPGNPGNPGDPGQTDGSVAAEQHGDPDDAPAGQWWARPADRSQVLAALAASPTAKGAHEMLVDDGIVTCGYVAFTRQLKLRLDPALYEGLTARGNDKGREAYLRASLYCRTEIAERNARWQADCQEVPVRVRPDNGGPTFKPWLIAILDEATRATVAAVLIDRPPTAVDVVAALALAIRGTTNHVGDFIGGIPEHIRWDNGREFMNEPVTNVCIRLGIGAHPSAPYSGWEKGKIERFHQSIQRELFDRQPGAVHGPKSFTGRRPWVGDDDQLLFFGALALLVEEYRYAYNNERKHTALGTTPVQAWRTNGAPLKFAEPEALHPLMLALPRRRKVAKDGISYANIKFVAPALAAWRGRSVEIRILPQGETFISVFDPDTGTHICDAHPSPNLSRAERTEILHKRNTDYRDLREALNDGARRRTEEAIIAGALEAEAGIPATAIGAGEDGDQQRPRAANHDEVRADADELLDLLGDDPADTWPHRHDKDT